MSTTRLCLLLALLFGLAADRPVYSVRFAVVGHLRDMAPNHVNILDALAEALAREDPDYIFLLGDLTYDGQEEHWQIIDRWLARIRKIAPVVAAPGNHDITQPPLWTTNPTGARDQYLRRFGYLYFHLVHDDADFVFINSCDDLERIVDYLELSLPTGASDKATILLGHYQLWKDVTAEDRARFPEWSAEWYYLWHKKFDWAEILPVIKGRVDAVLTGDAEHGGHKPLTIDGIDAYPIGIGSPGRGDPIVFFVGEIAGGGDLVMSRHDVELDAADSWYTIQDDFQAMWHANKAPRVESSSMARFVDRTLKRIRLRYVFLTAVTLAFVAGALAGRLDAARKLRG